jgi:uncharacterized protein YqiB (DUF1249 family)
LSKRKYVPDLTRQMAICDANYARILKLMPRIDHEDVREFRVRTSSSVAYVRLKVVERFAYTATLEVSQESRLSLNWLESPSLVVRLYHDAQMAEVICMKRRKQLSGVYPYPNREMHQPDEKIQLNHFLGEWLSHCLEYGEEMEPVYSLD